MSHKLSDMGSRRPVFEHTRARQSIMKGQRVGNNWTDRNRFPASSFLFSLSSRVSKLASQRTKTERNLKIESCDYWWKKILINRSFVPSWSMMMIIAFWSSRVQRACRCQQNKPKNIFIFFYCESTAASSSLIESLSCCDTLYLASNWRWNSLR